MPKHRRIQPGMKDKMNSIQIVNPVSGYAGMLSEVELNPSAVLVFQLPRRTDAMSEAYVNETKKFLSKILPEGKTALLIGSDINIYEVLSEEVVFLKLKGELFGK